MKKTVLLCGLLLGILTAITFSGCSAKTVVDFSKCTGVSFTGYEGEGIASITYDNAGLLTQLSDLNSMAAASLAQSFTVELVDDSVNGKLSNGDVVTIKVNTNQELLDNANVAVTNTELSFTVEGLVEKEALDIFSEVELEVSGISPKCSVSAVYLGNNSDVNSMWSRFEITDAQTGEQKSYYQDGDTVIVTLDASTLEYLNSKYSISETSCEYTVQADSHYVLSSADLSQEAFSDFTAAADEYFNQELEVIRNNSDYTLKIKTISGISGLNVGTLAANSCKINDVENISFNSSYLFSGASESICICFLYNADIAYYVNRPFNSIDETVSAIISVRIVDPTITPDGISYSEIEIKCYNDLESVLDGDYEQLS